jgi:hypothetical protein
MQGEKREAGRGGNPRPAGEKRRAIIPRPSVADHREITAARLCELGTVLAAWETLPPAERLARLLEKVRP